MTTEQRANEYQPGGKHYKADYQHWDLVIDTGMGYLDGCATKYIARFDKKGIPLQDLEKARHYLIKMIENVTVCALTRSHADRRWVDSCFLRFCRSNSIDRYTEQYVALRTIVFWETPNDLERAIDLVVKLTKQVEENRIARGSDIPPAKPVPADDSNRHAERATSVETPDWLEHSSQDVGSKGDTSSA